jgi:hypothetical protein
LSISCSLQVVKSLGSLFHDCTCHDIDILFSQLDTNARPISVFGTGTSCVSYIKDSLDAYLLERPSGVAKGPPPIDTVVGVITLESGIVVTLITRRRSVFGYDQRFECVFSKDVRILAMSTRNRSRESIVKEYQSNISDNRGLEDVGEGQFLSDLAFNRETEGICYSFDTRYASSMLNEVKGMISTFDDSSVEFAAVNEKGRRENIQTSRIADQLL